MRRFGYATVRLSSDLHDEWGGGPPETPVCLRIAPLIKNIYEFMLDNVSDVTQTVGLFHSALHYYSLREQLTMTSNYEQ